MNKLLWLGVLLIMVLTCGCGFDGTLTRHNDFVPLTSITISSQTSTIAANTSTKLTAIGNYSGQFTRDISDLVTWSSGTPAVAQFTTTGSPSRVTGVAPGSSVVTATVGTVTATYTVTVSSATISSVAITPATPTVPSGLTSQLAATGTFSDGTTQDVTLEAAWTSGTPSVATVSNGTSSKGLVTGVAVGTAAISATFDGISGSTTVTVSAATLKSIAITPANPSILSLSPGVFTAIGTYTDGSTADITSRVSWASSNTLVATVATGGTAATLKAGTVTISAALSGITGVTDLKVTGGNLTAITITPANGTMVKDTVSRIIAIGTFSTGAQRDITGAVSWSTDNVSLATVTAAGGNLAWLNALAVTPTSSPTVITAGTSSLTATTKLTVTAPVLQSVTLSSRSLAVTAGTGSRLTLTATFSTGTTQDVTSSASWSSGTPAVAEVGNSGLVKGRVNGVASGSSTVTATYGGISDTGTVTVTSRTIKSLVISGPSSITTGNKGACTATATYTDNTSAVVTEYANWSVDSTNVAIMADSTNQKGEVVAVSSGSTVISATFAGITAKFDLAVP